MPSQLKKFPDDRATCGMWVTKVLEFTSINPPPGLVPPHNLLINHLLPSGSDFIHYHRAHPMGIYKHTHGKPGVGEESYPFILVAVTQARK